MKQYHSRMDFLTVLINLLAVFVIDAAALIASSKALVRESGLTSFGLFLGAVSAPVALLIFFFPVRYFLGDSLLVVRSGVLRWRIPVENIHRAVRLRSISPSPALSLERIRIDYSKGSRVKRIFLSPADRTGFLNDLAMLDRGLSHDQNGLVRWAGRIMPLQAHDPGAR